MLTPQAQFMDSDMIVLHTVESYLKNLGVDMNTMTPESQLAFMQNARDYLYSEQVQRIPSIAVNILHSDFDTDDRAKALYLAISDHVMDPVFVNMLLQYLDTFNNNSAQEEKMVVGALLARIATKYIEDHTAPTTAKKDKTDKNDKKGDKTEEPAVTFNPDSISHIQEAIKHLLGRVANVVATKCCNLNYTQALIVAACIATNDIVTIKDIIATDLPITADVFDILTNPRNLVAGALLLEKKDYTKLTENQKKFIESLQRWTFTKLNDITQQQCYKFLASIYGAKLDTNKYLVNVRDCGTNYSNLIQVTKFFAN